MKTKRSAGWLSLMILGSTTLIASNVGLAQFHPIPNPIPRPIPPPIPAVVRATLPVTDLKIFTTENIQTGCFYRGGTGPDATARGAQAVAGGEFLYDDDCPAQVNHAFRTGVKFQQLIFPPSVFNKATLKFSLRENELSVGEYVRSSAATSTGTLVTNRCPLRAMLPVENWTGLPDSSFSMAQNWVDLPREGINNQFALDVTVLVNSWHGLGNRIENLGLILAGKNEDLGQKSNTACVSLLDNLRIEVEYDDR